jgi:hypothetical protein
MCGRWGDVPEPPLRRMHGDALYEQPGLARSSLEHQRRTPTEQIVASLAPGGRQALRATTDGLIKNGNTRIKVLLERGFDVNILPREIVE